MLLLEDEGAVMPFMKQCSTILQRAVLEHIGCSFVEDGDVIRVVPPVLKHSPYKVCLDRSTDLRVGITSAIAARVLCCLAPSFQCVLAQDVEAGICRPLLQLLEVLIPFLELFEDALLELLLILCKYSKLLPSSFSSDSFHLTQARSHQLRALEMRESRLSGIKRVGALIRPGYPSQESRFFELPIVYALEEGYSRSQSPLVETLNDDAVVYAIFESLDAQPIVPGSIRIAKNTHTIDIAGLS
jgi:hypothetical protein